MGCRMGHQAVGMAIGTAPADTTGGRRRQSVTPRKGEHRSNKENHKEAKGGGSNFARMEGCTTDL